MPSGPVHRSDFEAAVEEAESDLLAAREAWHAERGDIAPARTRMTGLPLDAPAAVKDAERRFLAVRASWVRVRDQWLAEQSAHARR